MPSFSYRILNDKLMSDVNFLEENKIINYSLRVKICKPVVANYPFLFHSDEYSYCIGIVDFLNVSSLKISQNPTRYAEKFLNNIKNHIKEIN